MKHCITLSDSLNAQVNQALYLFKRLIKAVERTRRPERSLQGGQIMFIVSDDHADVNFSITAPAVVDAEHHPVDPQPTLTYEVVSDNPDAVAVTFDSGALTGSFTFGAPGLANINATVTDASNNLVGSFGAQFTVTTGAAAGITGGAIQVEDLTEV